MDKRCLPSQPKAALPVGKYRLDVGNRYSISLPETLECSVGNPAEGRVRSTASQQPQRAVRIFADRLKHSSFQLKASSNNSIFQVNELGVPDYPEPARVV